MKYFPYFFSLLFAAGLMIAAPVTQAEEDMTTTTVEESDEDAIEAIDEGPCAGMIDRRAQLCRLKHGVGQRPGASAFGRAMALKKCRLDATPGTEEYRDCMMNLKKELHSNRSQFRNVLHDQRKTNRLTGRFNNRTDRAFKQRQASFNRTSNLFGRRADRLNRLSQNVDQAGFPGLSKRLGNLSSRLVKVSDRANARAARLSVRGDRNAARLARTRARVNRGHLFGIPDVLVTPTSTTTR